MLIGVVGFGGSDGAIGLPPPPPGVRRKGITSSMGTNRRTRVERDMGKVLIKRKRGIRLANTLSAQSHAHLSFDTGAAGFPNPTLGVPVGDESIPIIGTTTRGTERHTALATLNWPRGRRLSAWACACVRDDNLKRGRPG